MRGLEEMRGIVTNAGFEALAGGQERSYHRHSALSQPNWMHPLLRTLDLSNCRNNFDRLLNGAAPQSVIRG